MKKQVRRVLYLCLCFLFLNTSVMDLAKPAAADDTGGGNTGGTSQTAPADPVINPNGDIFTSAQSVTITNISSGDTAYYATDGGLTCLPGKKHDDMEKVLL